MAQFSRRVIFHTSGILQYGFAVAASYFVPGWILAEAVGVAKHIEMRWGMLIESPRAQTRRLLSWGTAVASACVTGALILGIVNKVRDTLDKVH